MNLKSANQNHFSYIPTMEKPRSQFLIPSTCMTTFNAGNLVPFYVEETLPGDTFTVRSSFFARLATPIFPVMHNMYMEVFYFFVPNRIVWDNFVKQHGQRTDPDDSVDYTTPTMNLSTLGTILVGSIWDQFGLPMRDQDQLPRVSALPFRMYNMIYNEWFRDQDLQDSRPLNKGNGPDPLSDYTLLNINKFKDYISTARPAPQKGPAVEIPILGDAPVVGIGKVNQSYAATTPAVYESDGTLRAYTTASAIDDGTTNTAWRVEQDGVTGYPNIRAVLSDATGPTVESLREAITIQQVYELDMRGGTRFVEMVYNHFGVTIPDFTLQLPEFLGYAKVPVNIHPVAQQSESNETPQGNLAAFGTSSGSAGFHKSFNEFGYVIGLVSTRADLKYQEALDKHWTRETRFEYYYPIFANIGEQPILRHEVAASTTLAYNEEAYGYAEAWAEYRFGRLKVNGLFRSSAAGTLDSWHWAQDLGDRPILNDQAVREDAPVKRTLAVPSEPDFIFDSVTMNNAARPIPMYSTPGLRRI